MITLKVKLKKLMGFLIAFKRFALLEEFGPKFK